MQKIVSNKTLGGYLRKIDLLCDQLKVSYQVECDNKEYAVNIFRSNDDSMDTFNGKTLHAAMINAIDFLTDETDSDKLTQIEKDDCSDQAELIKGYKEPKYSF